MNSSIGYHTFLLYKKITYKEARILYNDFKNCNKVNIIPSKYNKTNSILNNFEKNLCSYTSKYYYIYYKKENVGIHWELKISSSLFELRDKSDIELKTCTVKLIKP